MKCQLKYLKQLLIP